MVVHVSPIPPFVIHRTRLVVLISNALLSHDPVRLKILLQKTICAGSSTLIVLFSYFLVSFFLHTVFSDLRPIFKSSLKQNKFFN
jgi:hypothetical protein